MSYRARMSSPPAEAEAAAPLLSGLLDEILVWEILARLPPKSLLRCRAVSPAWRRATSTRRFLLAHHARQPTLPLVCASERLGAGHENILAFDHRAADSHLQPVARFEHTFAPLASCDGLLILYNYTMTDNWYSVCNLATRQHAPLRQLRGFWLLGMYAHRPTGEYRLLLMPRWGNVEDEIPEHQIGCYVFALGSDQLPRYIGATDATLPFFGHHTLGLTDTALLHDSLHWHPLQYPDGSKVVIVFDTMSESFRQMRAPDDVDAAMSSIFEMDSTLGLYSCCADMEVVNIWVLQDYQGEVWERKYNVKLLAAEIREQFKWPDDNWGGSVVSVDDDVLLTVSYGGWLFYIDTNGKVIDSFHRRGQRFNYCLLRLKQSLVPHTFFTALEGYVVNASPFV